MSLEMLAVELLTMVPQALLNAWVFCRLLSLRRPALFATLYTAAIMTVHFFTRDTTAMPLWVKPAFQMTIALALPCLFTRGSRVSAACLTLIQCLVMVLMELLMVSLTKWDASLTEISYFQSVSAAKLLQMRTIYNVLYGLVQIPIYCLWKRTCNSGMEYAAPELLPFLLGQTAMTILACAILLTDTTPSLVVDFVTAAAALMGLLAMGVVLRAYFGHQEWNRLERRRREVAQQTALQRHRAESGDGTVEAQRIRREVRRLLDEALEQLERREQSGAREQILGADQVLQSSRAERYCDHPVADAVLWEQAQRCKGDGIELELQAAIPVDAGISGAVLCSLFSNVLDNAVHACLGLPPGQRWIRCTAVCRGAYLILRAENPWNPKAPTHAGPSSGHGFGLRILSELARRCDGSVETCRENGRYRITVCLRRDLPEGGEEAAI